MMQRIGVIGAGAWGTALALNAARAGCDVVLLGRDAAAMHAIQQTRRNERYLAGAELPQSIMATADAGALSSCALILAVVPAQKTVTTLRAFQENFSAAVPILLCAKGIDHDSGAFLTDQMRAVLPDHPVGILSGPGFASDIAQGLPVAVSISFDDPQLSEAVAKVMSAPAFRPYINSDMRGVEIGGALKNVFAIAAGMVTGRRLGVSARAALITRSFAEMQRYGVAFGAKAETFAGLSGLGDLLLTATSEQSRNFRFGVALGQGESMTAAKARLGTVEGIATAHAARLAAKQKAIEMPITETIGSIIDGDETIDGAIQRLMARPLKAEG